jgi:catalase
VKFEWEPEAGIETLSIKEMVDLPKDYLEKELEQRLANEVVKFHLHIVLGEPGDVTDDPTKEWPKERNRIEAGVLTLKGKAAIDSDDLLFDPTIVPSGIECSDDEILMFRKHAYAVSHERRIQGE